MLWINGIGAGVVKWFNTYKHTTINTH